MEIPKKYKALFVGEACHKRTKIEATKNGLTIDEFILQMLKTWKQQSKV